MFRIFCFALCLTLAAAGVRASEKVTVLLDASHSMRRAGSLTDSYDDLQEGLSRSQVVARIVAQVVAQLPDTWFEIRFWHEGIAPDALVLLGYSEQEAHDVLWQSVANVTRLKDTELGKTLQEFDSFAFCENDLILIVTDTKPDDADVVKAELQQLLATGVGVGVFIVNYYGSSASVRFYRAVSASENYRVEIASTEAVLTFIREMAESAEGECQNIVS